ncbi:eukaryotic translation initiation factor 2 alpha subunit-domain-containing protein [Cladochytrium replicatum]|nr:eukaryotic translation initiation factor 2 alpha subunit-domain-containing protein [Cladochytrium replicatum]
MVSFKDQVEEFEHENGAGSDAEDEQQRTIIRNPGLAEEGGEDTPSALAAQAESQVRLQCRFYENKYPEIDDLVMVNVRQIAEMGAYVHLMEYNNIEGMILLSELSRRRIRSIQKLIRVGQKQIVVVIRVDKEKGYIDLSKRRVSPEDVIKCEEKYRKSSVVHSIMYHVAQKLDMELEQLYQEVGWPLYKQYGHAFEAFMVAINEPDEVFKNIQMSVEVRRELMSMIRRRMTPKEIKIRADLEVTCFGYEGIDAIKAALAAGEECSTEEVKIKIKLVAPPLYVMYTHALDKVLGVELLEKAIAKVEETIKSSGGNLQIKMKPKSVTETDDAELDAMLDKASKENAEVAGDDDDDEMAAEDDDEAEDESVARV